MRNIVKLLIGAALIAVSTAACVENNSRPNTAYRGDYRGDYRGNNGGYWNSARADADRDGVPNRYDRDANGDGVPDRYQGRR